MAVSDRSDDLLGYLRTTERGCGRSPAERGAPRRRPRATAHWLAADQLARLGVTAVDERVVIDGH